MNDPHPAPAAPSGRDVPAPLSAREVAALRDGHFPCTNPKHAATFGHCYMCEMDWPCPPARWLATLEAATSAARREGFEEALKATEGANPHRFGERCDAEEPGFLCAREDGVLTAVAEVRAARAEPPQSAGEGK